jgi:hypothetical protein
MSSAYRIDVSYHRPSRYLWILSIPLSAMLANKGLTTPPCGVPCSGNSGLVPAFKQRNMPALMPLGAIRFSIIVVWLIRSKHFSISSSITLLLIPLL